jgi:DNA primase
VTFSPAFLDEIRARTTLSTLVQRSTALKKAGAEWKACCPFHQEKTPSFWVNDAKGFYHCFGCGAHGDAIRWMIEQGGLSFVDAVKELAAGAGLEIPASDPQQERQDREREEMLTIMRRAQERFRDYLPGLAAQYLDEKRAIPERVAVEFELGYAPAPRAAPPLLESLADVGQDKLIALGLVRSHPETGELRDFFRRRVMIPIHDARGRVIAFGGRVLGQGEPKYLNSPDTPLFDKGRTLFNLHRAAPAARKAGRLVIVEGYMDVIALHIAGVGEAVAPNGTALTEHQLLAAWKLAQTPICCFDGDRAGQAAAHRAAVRALPLLEAGRSLAFVSPPAGQDPDDIRRAHGADGVTALLAAPKPLVDVLWEAERAAEPTSTPEQVAGLKARLRAHVRSIRNADVREAYGRDIKARFDRYFAVAAATPARAGPRSQPAAERKPFSRPAPASRAQRDIARGALNHALERAILIGLVRFPDMLRQLDGVTFRAPPIDSLVERLVPLSWRSDPAPTEAELIEMMDISQKGELAKLASGKPLPFSFARSTIVDQDRSYEDLAAAVAALRSPTSRRGARRPA